MTEMIKLAETKVKNSYKYFQGLMEKHGHNMESNVKHEKVANEIQAEQCKFLFVFKSDQLFLSFLKLAHFCDFIFLSFIH